MIRFNFNNNHETKLTEHTEHKLTEVTSHGGLGEAWDIFIVDGDTVSQLLRKIRQTASANNPNFWSIRGLVKDVIRSNFIWKHFLVYSLWKNMKTLYSMYSIHLDNFFLSGIGVRSMDEIEEGLSEDHSFGI